MFDKRAALIVRCAGLPDLISSVDFARTNSIPWLCEVVATTYLAVEIALNGASANIQPHGLLQPGRRQS